MARRCELCGKETVTGNSVARRGLAKKHGGVGRRVLRRTKRKFKPNIQRVRAVVNDNVQRLKVCTDCLRKGKVTKPFRTLKERKRPEPIAPVSIPVEELEEVETPETVEAVPAGETEDAETTPPAE